MAKRIIRIILNILIIIGVCIVLINILTGRNSGMLSASGTRTFHYFTTLSNLLEALAAAVFLFFAARRKGQPVPRAVEAFKYIAAAEIFVTFTTIVAFLAPVYGFAFTCSGNNFWYHLVFPLAAVLEQIFLSEEKMGIRENLFAVIPTFLYGCFYVINIAVNGKGEGLQTNDWYGFLNWGLPVGIGIFAAICLLSFLLGLALRGLWKAAHRVKT